MKSILPARPAMAVLASALAAAAGCADIDRSRDLGNPAVPALALAQQVCSNCHGVTGNAVSPNFPNLAGQQKAYLAAQLRAFKSHGRQDPAGFEYMWGLSRDLTDAQIDGLAEYFAAQQPRPQPTAGDPARVEAGRSIFVSGLAAKNVPACSTCHGAEGQGNGTIPRIALQHADYLVKQLIVFQRTDQRPEGGVMKTVAHELGPQDIENVAAFLQSGPR